MKVVDEMISIMKLKIVFLRLDIFFPVFTNIALSKAHGCERIFFPVFTNIVNGMGVKEDELILQS